MLGENQGVALVQVDQPVDRTDQINKFNRVLDRIRSRRPVSTNLLEWHGGPGIGKTTLITLLLRECEQRRVPRVLVNFNEPERLSNKYLDDPTQLIEDIVNSLTKTHPVDTHTLQDRISEHRASAPPRPTVSAYFEMPREERLYQKPPWLISLQNVTAEFVKLLVSLAQNEQDSVQPVAAFFDETEYADTELADWIEEWIIKPLVQMKHCVVVWASRRPWRWKRPEIRRRLYSERLEVFSQDDVKQQFQLNSANPSLAELFFKDVHVVTGGHPFANAVVISQIDDWTTAGQVLTPETFTNLQPDLLGEIFRRFIVGYAFKGLDAPLKTAGELLAMVRLFDTTMLREVLQACGGKGFAAWHQEDFGDLMLRLKRTQLLVWDKGYALDSDLRYVIQEYTLACEPQMYVAVNRAALQVYQNWLEKPVDNRGLFVIEELYHQACLRRAGEPVGLEEVLEARLQQYPNWIRDRQVLRNSLERLEGELVNDSELARFTDSLSSTKLAERVQRFSASLPNSSLDK
jgi:hypothetical protein